MIREQKGITLIALVVTIIVLLILAGVTIAMLTGENGILNNATDASAKNAEAQAEEQAKLAYMAVRTEIATQLVDDRSYSALTNGETLLSDVVEADLTTGWTCDFTSPSITMTYEDSALPDGAVTYKMTLTATSATWDGKVANPEPEPEPKP